jgi:capsular polysaccharide biosynthesis protein
MNIFTPPSSDDLIRLLKAWKFWVLGAILGAVIGAAVHIVASPPYRARATVLVDFNLEQALPNDTDRQHFYYLERETRKLEEVAWSDEVIGMVASETSVSVESLRGGILQLSQPAEGGWHFYAEDTDANLAGQLASAWAQGFTAAAQQGIDSGELNPFIKLEMTQSADLPVERSVPLSIYSLIGALGFLAISAFVVLFLLTPGRSPIGRGEGGEE